MHRNQSVNTHQFAMIPRADIPRSVFDRQSTHKTTFDAGYLVPMYVDEVLPGDTFRLSMTMFARMTTPLFPIMDNLRMTSFFFFVPMRLVWENTQKFMGEQVDPGDSIDYLIPEVTCPAGGYAVNSLQDYFGLPTVGQMGGSATFTHNTLPLRAYNLIWNEWFRDENLQDSVVVDRDDGPDNPADYVLLRRGKRHDYFTSALPWPQKGEEVLLPLGDKAPVIGLGTSFAFPAGSTSGVKQSDGSTVTYAKSIGTTSATVAFNMEENPANPGFPNVFTDLSAATAATVNQLRQAFQVQKFLERSARGGTRYTEIIRSMFGVISPDARLQRPEYLGGSSQPVNISPIAQTSGTGASGTDAPMGTLAAMGTMLAHNHGFTQSFTEHGYVIGLVSIQADLTYQQGVRKLWNRSTRFDHYWPVFAALGEQAVLNREIYVQGTAADTEPFGYQERWAEYRYFPSLITGQFRSTYATPLDGWHLAQRFTSLPTLNSQFIQDNPPMSRVLAVGTEANGSQFYADAFIDIRTTRAMPMFGVPGLIDHF